MTRHRYSDAYKVYKRIAKSNKKSITHLDHIKSLSDNKNSFHSGKYPQLKRIVNDDTNEKVKHVTVILSQIINYN